MRSFRIFAMAAAFAMLSTVTPAQSASTAAQSTSADNQTATPPNPPNVPGASKAPPTPVSSARSEIARWFELQNATLNLRYRFIDTTAGRITTNQLQHRETVRARVKFDTSAKYTWNFGVFTGTRFSSGWDNTGWGIADAQKNFAFKASYFSAIP